MNPFIPLEVTGHNDSRWWSVKFFSSNIFMRCICPSLCSNHLGKKVMDEKIQNNSAPCYFAGKTNHHSEIISDTEVTRGRKRSFKAIVMSCHFRTSRFRNLFSMVNYLLMNDYWAVIYQMATKILMLLSNKRRTLFYRLANFASFCKVFHLRMLYFFGFFADF